MPLLIEQQTFIYPDPYRLDNVFYRVAAAQGFDVVWAPTKIRDLSVLSLHFGSKSQQVLLDRVYRQLNGYRVTSIVSAVDLCDWGYLVQLESQAKQQPAILSQSEIAKSAKQPITLRQLRRCLIRALERDTEYQDLYPQGVVKAEILALKKEPGIESATAELLAEILAPAFNEVVATIG